MIMYTKENIYTYLSDFSKWWPPERMLRMLEELNGFGSVSEIEMVKKCSLQNMSIMFLMFHSRWTNAESEKLAMPTHFLSVRLVSGVFFSPLFSFFLGLNYDEPGSNSSLQGSQKPSGRSWTWVVCMTLGDHHTYAIPNWRRNRMVCPPAGYSLICQTWQTENARGFGSVQFLEHTLTEIADCCNPNDLAELYGEWLAILNWLNVLRCNCQFCSSGSCLWGSNCLNVLSLIWLDARQWGSLCGVNETGPRHLSFGCLKTQTPKYQEAFVVGSQIHGFFFLLFWHLTGSILPPPTECDLIGGFVSLHTAGRERKRAAN